MIHRAEVFTTSDYHYIVMRDGSIKEIVPLADKGAHAIAFNGSTVGVAVFGDFASLEPGKNNHPTPNQLASCVTLLRRINEQYGNALWCSGHSQLGPTATDVPLKLVTGHTCPGENFPLMQVILDAGLKPYKP